MGIYIPGHEGKSVFLPEKGKQDRKRVNMYKNIYKKLGNIL